MFETLRTGGKKDEKIINVQDGISPYRTEKQSKINKSYMYLYSRLKSNTYRPSKNIAIFTKEAFNLGRKRGKTQN